MSIATATARAAQVLPRHRRKVTRTVGKRVVDVPRKTVQARAANKPTAPVPDDFTPPPGEDWSRFLCDADDYDYRDYLLTPLSEWLRQLSQTTRTCERIEDPELRAFMARQLLKLAHTAEHYRAFTPERFDRLVKHNDVPHSAIVERTGFYRADL